MAQILRHFLEPKEGVAPLCRPESNNKMAEKMPIMRHFAFSDSA